MRGLSALIALVLVGAAGLFVSSAVSQETEAAGTTIVTDQRFVCSVPIEQLAVDGLPLTIVSNVSNAEATSEDWANGVVNFNAGCVGDGTDAIDVCLHVNGNGSSLGSPTDAVVTRGARDIQFGCPDDGPRMNVDCGEEAPGAHQDGVATHEGYRLTFTGLDSGDWPTQTATCHGAGAVIYWSAGVNAATRIPSRGVDLLCVECRVVGSKHPPQGTGLGIYESTDSGAVDSCFSANAPITIRLDTPEGPNRGALRPVNLRNLEIDRNASSPQPSPGDCPVGDDPPPPTTTGDTTTEPPPTTTEPPPPVCDAACIAAYELRIEALTTSLAGATEQLGFCRRKLSEIDTYFHERPHNGTVEWAFKMHAVVHRKYGCLIG